MAIAAAPWSCTRNEACRLCAASRWWTRGGGGAGQLHCGCLRRLAGDMGGGGAGKAIS